MASKKSSKKASSGSRVKPMIGKAGVTKNRSRRFECGGKLKKG